MNNLNILKQLSEAFGPSGFEEEVNTIISNEFNSLNTNCKLGASVDHILDFKFPLAKSLIYVLHNFDNPDYNRFIGHAYGDDLSIKSKKINYSILDD